MNAHIPTAVLCPVRNNIVMVATELRIPHLDYAQSTPIMISLESSIYRCISFAGWLSFPFSSFPRSFPSRSFCLLFEHRHSLLLILVIAPVDRQFLLIQTTHRHNAETNHKKSPPRSSACGICPRSVGYHHIDYPDLPDSFFDNYYPANHDYPLSRSKLQWRWLGPSYHPGSGRRGGHARRQHWTIHQRWT